MPILKERQGVGIYSALLKQNGGNFATAPAYRCSLSRVQAGSGFLRNTFTKFKNALMKSKLAKNIGQEVINQAKREIPAILSGEKGIKEAVKDAVSSQNLVNTIKAGVQKTIQSGSGEALKRKIEEGEEDEETPVKRLKGGNSRIPQKSKMKIRKTTENVFDAVQ